MALLFLVTDVVDANCVARAVFDRLVACGVWHAQDRDGSVVCLALFNGFKRRAGQNGANRPSAAVGLRHTGRDADVFVASLYKERGCHPLAILLSDRINYVEIVVHLRGAKIQGRSILAANGFLAVSLRGS